MDLTAGAMPVNFLFENKPFLLFIPNKFRIAKKSGRIGVRNAVSGVLQNEI